MKNNYETDVITAMTLFERYWKWNGERAQEWVEKKIVNEYMGEPIDFDLFEREFPFNSFEDESFGYVVNEHLDFLGPTVIRYFLDAIERRFERIVDDFVRHLEMEKIERAWQEEEYRRAVI